MTFKISDELNEISQILDTNGFSCYLVGGAVRNQLLGLEEKDYDLATDAFPDEIMKIFKKVIPTGIKHGTVTVLYKKESYEITTFRVDGDYSDGRRPDSIEFTSNIFEDLKRRDFTINSIAYNIKKKELIDPNNGLADLKNKIIRAIGDPHKRFQEDGLRPLRACRFAAQLNFHIEEKTFNAIKKSIEKFKSVSKERIYDELVKTMKADKPSITFNLLYDSGLLQEISPSIANCKGIIQRKRHLYDVFDHLLYACDYCPKNDKILRFAALFHDIGKLEVLKYSNDNTPTFYNHEIASSEIAFKLMKRLKFPNRDINKIQHLIKHHMFNYESTWTDGAIRRFISKAGLDNIEDLIKLQQADLSTMNNFDQSLANLNELKTRIKKLKENENAFSIKDLKIDGNVLINEMRFSQSPRIGIILKHLLECVLDDPNLNERSLLKQIAEEYYEELNKAL